MAMFGYEFMQRAFWAGGLIGIIAPLLGVYLMLRRQALMADTLSHVSLAGVALGSVLHLNPALCGFAVAIAGGVVIEQLRRSYRTYSELPVAIIMNSGLALAVVLMSVKQNLSQSFRLLSVRLHCRGWRYSIVPDRCRCFGQFDLFYSAAAPALSSDVR